MIKQMTNAMEPVKIATHIAQRRSFSLRKKPTSDNPVTNKPALMQSIR